MAKFTIPMVDNWSEDKFSMLILDLYGTLYIYLLAKEI